MEDIDLSLSFAQPLAKSGVASASPSSLEMHDCDTPPSSCGSPTQQLVQPYSQLTQTPTSRPFFAFSGQGSDSAYSPATKQPFYQLDLSVGPVDEKSTGSLKDPSSLYQSAESIASIRTFLSEPSTASLSSLDLSISGGLDTVESIPTSLLPQVVDTTGLLSFEDSLFLANSEKQPSQPILLTTPVSGTVTSPGNLASTILPHISTDASLPAGSTTEPWLAFEGNYTVDTADTSFLQSLIFGTSFSTVGSVQQAPHDRSTLQPPPPHVTPSMPPAVSSCAHLQVDASHASVQPTIPIQPVPINCDSKYACSNTDTFDTESYFQRLFPATANSFSLQGLINGLPTRPQSTTAVSSMSVSPLISSTGASQPSLFQCDVSQNQTNHHHLRCDATRFQIQPCPPPPPLTSPPYVRHHHCHPQQQHLVWPVNGIPPSTLSLHTPSIASVLSQDAVLAPPYEVSSSNQAMGFSMSLGGESSKLLDPLTCGDSYPLELSSAFPHTRSISPPYVLPHPASYKRRMTTAYARWTVQEDRQLAEAVEMAMSRRRQASSPASSSTLPSTALDWHFISSKVPTRSPTQCHARWSKVLAEQRRARKINNNCVNNEGNSSNNTILVQLNSPNRQRSASSSSVSTLEHTQTPCATTPTSTTQDSILSSFSDTSVASSNFSPSSLSSSSSSPSSATIDHSLETTTMLGILRGRWTAKEDQELMALVDRYLAEKGGLTLLRPPPLPRSLPEGNSWSIKDVFHECMALNNPNNPEERRARGFPDWFQGSPEEYEHLVDATVATIPWNQLVLQMTPLPLISTTEDRECQQNERLAMEHVIKDVERGQSNMSQQYSKVPVADSTKDLSPHSSTATMQIPRLPRFGHRLGVQAQARWAEALDPRVRREPWSPIEDSLLRRAVDECAKCWIKISEWMPGRTQRQCRTRWVQLTIKAERAEAKRLARAQTTRRRQ